jgi:predicted flap endonuclease-1-like 5' DNA nuclease
VKLQEDVKTYKEIAALKQSEVQSVAQLLRGELRREGRRSFWSGFALNLLFFVLGAVVTVLLPHLT